MVESYNIGFERVLEFFARVQKETPKGVNFHRLCKGGKNYLNFRFTLPSDSKRLSKPSGEDFTVEDH